MLHVRRERRHRGRLKKPAAVPAILLLALLSGCASAPKHAVTDLWKMLPDSQSVYVSSRIENNRGLLKNILSGIGENTKTLSMTVDRTYTIALSAFLSRSEKPSFDIIASGSFPEAVVSWQMFWDRDWHRKKQRLAGKTVTWWENDRDLLQMSVVKNNLLRVSNGRISALLQDKLPGEVSLIPEAALAMGNDADFFIYVPNPTEVLAGSGMESRVLLGISTFWAGLERLPAPEAAADKKTADSAEAAYFIRGTFVLRDERAARVYGALIKVSLAAWLNRMGIGNLKTVREQLVLTTSGNLIEFSGLTVPGKAIEKVMIEYLRNALPEKAVAAE